MKRLLISVKWSVLGLGLAMGTGLFSGRPAAAQDAAEKAAVSSEEAKKTFADAATLQNNNPLWTNRVGNVDWHNITKWVAQDIILAKEGM